MTRLILFAAALIATIALAACTAPTNQPCLYDNSVRYTHLSPDGKTLLIVCEDGKVVVQHP